MRLSTLTVFLALVIAGCGSDDSESTTTASQSTPDAMTATETPAPADGPVTVDIKGFTFAPKTTTVAVGEKVTWTDSDKSNHNVVFDDKAQKGISNIRPGEEKSVTFSEAGTFAYVCAYHPGMAGTVEVQ
jgi:plastocyanin